MKYLIIALTALYSATASAKETYVCNIGGDDSADGSYETPIASYDKAAGIMAKMKPGDGVLFCKGGDFPATIYLIRGFECTEAAPCTWSAYDSPLISSTARPKIHSAVFLTLMSRPHKDGWLIIDGLEYVGTGQSWGIFLQETDGGVPNVHLNNLDIHGFDVGVYNKGGRNLKLTNSFIHGNEEQGFLGGGNGGLIKNTVFDNNGFGLRRGVKCGALCHNVYLSGETYGMMIVYNTLTNSALNSQGQCTGAPLVGHGKHTNLTVAYNQITEEQATPQCWGMALDIGSSSIQYFKTGSIHHNTITYGDVGTPSRLAIGLSNATDFEIYSNIVVNMNGTGIKIPDRDEGDTHLSDRINIYDNDITAAVPINVDPSILVEEEVDYNSTIDKVIELLQEALILLQQ